jgi:hypothetical protein
MYTGTLIKDLMAAVERAELRAQRKSISEEMELQRLFEMRTSQQTEASFAGAA